MNRKFKRFIFMTVTLIATFAIFVFAACGGNGGGNGGTVEPGNTQKPTETVPTSAQVVNAISDSMEDEEQNYDFTFNLAGSISIGAMQSPNANANYVCNYRYNSATGALKFKRVTSGILLYDATEYIYSAGDSRVSVKMNEDNKVKKVVVDYKDTDLNLINIPFTTLIGSLSAGEIENIAKVSPDNYKADLKLSAENSALNSICSFIGKMDTNIDFKGVTVTNPVNGVDFEFTMPNGEFTGYTVKASVSVPVKGVDVTFNLTYTQKVSDTPVVLPDISGVVTDSSQIETEISAINAALTGVKSEATYSLDLEAVNEMDPAWNIGATKDWYKACLYKNTTADDRIDFNHSYIFHSHHEKDGDEEYKYVIGNIQDGSTYLRSFKGNNACKPIENVSADSQFEFLTKYFIHSAAEVDCYKKTTSQDTSTYTIYFKDSAVVQMSKNIVAILNTHEADGVVEVNNYFNDESYTIKDAALTVVMNGGAVVSISLETKIKYNPIAGDYTENNVTLDNTLTLYVNKSLSAAKGYKAPEKPDGVLSHIDYKTPNV